MLVIDMKCGDTLHAANDKELFGTVRRHIDEEHPDLNLSDDEIREVIAERAYEATDS
jgi:predicted small metal-binding protein